MIEDMSVPGNGVRAINSSRALEAAEFVEDTTDPRVSSFDLNMNAGTLDLHFPETMNASSLDITGLTLQQASDATGDDAHSLSAVSTWDLSTDSTTISITIARADLDELKRKEIGRRPEDSWLVVNAGSIEDMNGRPVRAAVTGVSAIPVDGHTADTTSPELSEFDFNLNSGILTLRFSETVKAGSLDVGAITLQASRAVDAVKFTLTAEHSGAVSSASGHTIQVRITGDDADDNADLNVIKRLRELAISPTSTFLSVAAAGVEDMNSRPLVVVEPISALNATTFDIDETDPELRSYSLDMSSPEAVLFLTFSETVDGSTARAARVVLQSDATDVTGVVESFTLVSSTASTSDSIYVNITLSEGDLNEVKKLLSLASSENSTFLRFVEGETFVADMAGRANAGILAAAAQPVATGQYAADVTSPVLRSFDLNMTSEILTLSFSETVKTDALVPARIAIQPGGCDTGVRLTGGTKQSANGPVQLLKLTLDDLNAIKDAGIARSADTTYLALVFEGGIAAITDVATDSNDVTPIGECAALRVDGYGPDAIDPALEKWTLNMATGEIYLFMSETFVGDVDMAQLTLSSALSTVSPLSSSIPSQSTVTRPAYARLKIELDGGDLNRIKFADSIGQSALESYINIASEFGTDTVSNNLAPVSDSRVSLEPGDFVSDNIAPVLRNFSINLSERSIELTFNECVRASSLKSDGITLQDSADSPTQTVTLAEYAHGDGEFVTADAPEGTIVSVNVRRADMDEVLLQSSLCRTAETCFISVAASAIADMQGNEIESATPISAANFVVDETVPTLEQFSLNMSSGILSLTFSEAVRAASLNASRIVLQDSARAFVSVAGQAPDYSYTLTGGSVGSPDGFVLDLELTLFDLNHIKRLTGLARVKANTYITTAQGAVSDLIGNELGAIPDGSGVLATVFETDNVPPSVVGFDVVRSANGGLPKLILRFSETVDASSLDTTKIILQSASANGAGTRSHRLTSGSVEVVPLPDQP
jgi:hypothetical protein